MRRKKAKKVFTYTWAFDPFDSDVTFCEKRMFGGLAAYVQGRMVMVLVESPGQRSYRGRDFDEDLWNGILLPTDKSFHESLEADFSALHSHPVLGKWLYLPANHEDFETTALEIGQKIASGDLRLGIDPKIK